MSSSQGRKYAAGVFLLLWAAGANAGCGRMVLGRVAAVASDGGGDVTAEVAHADAHADADDGADLADLATDRAVPDDGPSVPPQLPQVCTSTGWCWTHPLPTSDRFVRALWVADDDLWLIGASGTIVRHAGGAWSTILAPTEGLSAIWASGSDDVWVGGPAGPFHWNGQSWAQVPPPTSPDARPVYAIWGCAPDDVWVMGPVATHWDGHVLSYVDMPLGARGFRSVWGFACDDVWAGYLNDSLGSGRVEHWDGTRWQQIASRPAEQIAGTGPDDVWSLAQGQLFRWSGLETGTLQNSHTLDLFPAGAAAIGTLDQSHVVSLRARDGATVLPVAAPATVSALWGRAAGDIWGFGARGTAAHWDGAGWTAHLPGWTLGGDDAVRVTGSDSGDLWAVVGSTLLHGDGSTWQTALTSQQVGGRIDDLWARTPDDVWVLGGDTLIHHWRGGAWTTENPLPSSTLEMRAISGAGPDDVWILRGTNNILHWDGHSWIGRQPQVGNIARIWAPGPNELWVVGDTVSHWSGAGWNASPRLPFGFGGTPFTAVGGAGPDDVWVLAGGYVLKASADYADLSVVMNSSWRAVSLSSAGAEGLWVMFQDGATTSRLYRLAGTPPAVAGEALIAPGGLGDLWSAPDGTLWAAGTGGALIRKRPAP